MKKRIIVIGLVALCASDLLGQKFELSPKVGFGAGRIYSRNLAENFGYRNDIDGDVLTWDVKQKIGFMFGIGACFQYNINDRLSAFVEPSFYSLNQKTKIDYIKNSLDGNGSGEKRTIISSAKIKMSWMNLPFMIQYGFGENNAFRISGGMEFLFLRLPEIESDETKITETYINFGLVDNRIEIAKVSGILNEFKSPRTSFVLGLGTIFKISDKNLYLDLRYRLPLTKSTMYTTDANYDDKSFKNNEVFDIWGKADAELDAPQFPLDDYRLNTVEIVLRYVLFQK